MAIPLLKRIWTLPLILFLSLALILPWPLVASAEEMTVQKEKEIGQRFHMKIAALNVLLDDPQTLKYYQGITDRIMRGAGLSPDKYHFYILNSNSINAFAVPGGYIYMNTETIISLENEGQLAAILGHEVAHITSRHFARRVEAASTMSMAYLATMLAGLILASQGGRNAGAFGPALMIGGTGAAVSSMMANSREDEAEADGKGRQYLTKAGYNPRDMYGAFKIMAERTFQVAPKSDLPTYLTTHPALTSRLATSFSDVEKSAPSPPDPAYQAFRDRVLALSGEERRVQTLLTKRLNGNPQDSSAIHALGLLAARQQNLSQADKLMTQALALSPTNKEYLADLGDLALRRRQPAEAKTYFEKAGQDSRQVVFGLARSAELLGDQKRATTLYEKVVNIDPDQPYPEALQMAGRFFGQIGRKGQGHYYLGNYFSSIGNLDQAIFHFKEALKQPDIGNFRARSDRELKVMEELKKEDKK